MYLFILTINYRFKNNNANQKKISKETYVKIKISIGRCHSIGADSYAVPIDLFSKREWLVVSGASSRHSSRAPLAQSHSRFQNKPMAAGYESVFRGTLLMALGNFTDLRRDLVNIVISL